ncbi:MAG TPA: RNA polymerase sigma factor SigZ [Acidobacteriota bacterium]|nr:RNA polymerase sigma factor SigZ [Acidobacteriota bacterium]
MSQQVTTADVYQLLSARLRSFLLSRTRDAQLADDLLQETFLRVHEKLDSLREGQRLNGWVFQIARNLVVDHFRASGRTLPADPAQEAAENEGPRQGRFSSNLNVEVASWLPAALESLPPEYAEAVRLYEVEGLSQQEIADRLGLSLSGAKSRIQRGRQKLKQVLDDCCRFQLDRRGNVLSYHPRDCGCDSCD